MSSAIGGEPEAPSPRVQVARRPRFRLPEELGVLCALLLLVIVIGTHNSDFVRSDNLFNLIASNSFFGMIALSAVFLLALGEIDLSVGWNFNLSAVIAALMMTHGWNPWIGAIVGILFGGLLGLVNGLLSTGLHLPVIIVTLGTYSAYHGLSLVLSHSAAVVPPDDSGTFFRFSQSYVGRVPTLAIIFAAGWVATQATYFVGSSNGFVAIYQGVPYQLPFGLHLYTKIYESGVPVSSLTPHQQHVLLNHEIRTNQDAKDLVATAEQNELQ